MVGSAVEICNMALTLLGAGRISALDAADEKAVLCNLFYEPVLDEALQEHPWSFAKFRQVLQQPTVTNYSEWEYLYALPEDPYCLKPLELLEGADYSIQEHEKYEINQRYLYTNLESAYLLYIGRPTEDKTLSSSFVNYFSTLLASRLCYKIVQSEKLMTYLEQKAAYLLAKAKALDGREGVNRPGPSTSWADIG